MTRPPALMFRQAQHEGLIPSLSKDRGPTHVSMIADTRILVPLPRFLVALGLAVAAAAASAEEIAIEATPVALDAGDPSRRTVGRLEYLAGYVLDSRHPAWGGFSGMRVSTDGATLLAVADVGQWLMLSLDHDRAGRLIGVGATATLAPLLDENGRPPAGKIEGDAEAVFEDADGGLIVAFEQRHRLMRYDADEIPAGRPRRAAEPAGLSSLPANEGIEAGARLPDGRLLLLSEGGKDGAGLRGWLLDDTWSAVSLERTGDYAPTDLALLPDGDLLLLERRYTPLGGPGARLSIVPAASVQSNARLTGEEVARITLPLSVDNFEALAVRRAPDGFTLVYLLSDDNRNILQRTLLLQFRLR